VSGKFILKSDEEQVVLGPVYSPDDVDSDGEAMTKEAIRKMAYSFLMNNRVHNIDILHNFQKSGCCVVESFIAREGDPDFTPGTWGLGVKCTDEVWAEVKKGKLNSFSLAGPVRKNPRRVLVEIVDAATGMTEKSTVDILPIHEHEFYIRLDESGSVVAGKTNTVLGHSHEIKYVDATEETLGHAHRINLDR